jgi:Cu/Ag efflux protein CusF
MRKTALALMFALVLVSVPAFAGHDHDAKGKNHDVTAEVVSVDMDAKTITIKTDDGKTTTAPVMGEAVGQLKGVKAGEKVKLTCHDKENGDHEGVTAIKKAS